MFPILQMVLPMFRLTPFLLKDWERYDVSRVRCSWLCFPGRKGNRSVPTEKSEIKWGTIQKDLASLVGGDPLDHSVFLLHVLPCDTPLATAQR